MAVWRAENSMLTQKGVEILNKVKAGIGSITVTRIVAGSGRVAESTLFFQTSISGTTKPMVLSQASSTGSGSELSIYITNTGFTESFDLNQIGVYVTHPDYLEEQLYHISQCDAQKFDTIPVLDETPVTLGYSIYLEHGSSSSISITVDPQGMTLQEDFNAFKGDIISGNIVEADENGNLKDSGKQISAISNPNLIHNWYFLNPVNRQNGYYAVSGAFYYKDASLTTVAGTFSSNTMVNYVNSVYGTVVINRITYYVPSSSLNKGYTGSRFSIDRWYNSATFLNPTLQGLNLRQPSTVTGNTYLVQDIDKFNSADSREVTLSVLLSTGKLLTSTGTVIPPTTEASALVTSVTFGTVSFECWRRSDERFVVQFRLSSGSDITVVAVKLEFGSVQTLAYKDSEGMWVLSEVPNFADEMSICAQYDVTTGRYAGAIPYGYIEEYITVSSAEALDSKLDSLIDGMYGHTVKYVTVNFSIAHPVLGGGTRVFRIDKIQDAYCLVQALGYREEKSGVVAEFFRSKYNSAWTSWVRTYNTLFKPTPAEIGAFGAYAYASDIDLNDFTSLGSIRAPHSTNKPAGTSEYGLIWNIIGADSVYLVQYYLDAVNKKVYRRFRVDNVWTTWSAESVTTVLPAVVE